MTTTPTPPMPAELLTGELAEKNKALRDSWQAEHNACYGEFGADHAAAISLEEEAWNAWLEFCWDNNIAVPGVQIEILMSEADLGVVAA